MLEFLAITALYIVPLYITNSCALVFGGRHSIDFGKKFMGKPIFDKGKTIEGTAAGLFIGLVAVFAIDFFFGEYATLVHDDYLVFGGMLCLGAIVGDIMASFIKRRLGIKKGSPVILLDQLDFVIGGIAFSYWMRIPVLEEVALVIALTLVVHRLSNYIAFRARVKNVPW